MRFSFYTGDGPEIPEFLALHDSATGMVLALSDFLKGKPYEGLDAVPTSEIYASIINSIPASWRKNLYSRAGKFSAVSTQKVGGINAFEVDRWVCDLYPERKYPAIAIGSCNGAMIHFCAATGIPWLPQTVLVPIDKKESFPVDEPKKTMEWAQEPAEIFLNNNPGWQLHHMMDPNQDRLRVDKVGYFRIKKIALGKWYEKFITERLEPGGKIFLIDCSFKWPACKMGERHFFQFGGAGGLAPEEYYKGSPAVKEFLLEAGTGLEQWDAPVPDTEAPEAEWGLEKALEEDITKFAKQQDIALTGIAFEDPQDASSAIAEFYRNWYREQGTAPDKLLIETFNIITPFLGLKKRCVPYWLFFNVDAAADDLERYLNTADGFEEIYMMILSHGKYSKGSTQISRWESLMRQARQKCSFIGTNPAEYPVDMAVYSRYSKDLKKNIDGDHPLPRPMEFNRALELLKKHSKEGIRIYDI